jgi:hypothetical protein
LPSYTTPATSTAQSGTKFEAVFKNASGETTTSEVTLTVNPPPPTVTSIEPSSGPTAGSTAVTIKGKGFLTGSTVTIGGAASEVKFVSEKEITAKTPPGSGTHEVVLTDGGGTSTLGPSYTYIPPPTVTLKPPLPLSNNTTPSFTGEASETTPVTVKIYAGATVKGSVVSTATAIGTGGSWNSGNASPALEDGQYTATATQAGSLGNPAGVSNPVTFTVDTLPPTVTLTKAPALSKNTTPSFEGGASEATEVVVHVFLGSEEVASAKATAAGGVWSTSGAALSKALPAGTNKFTAYATEKSSLGNADGRSTPPVSFEVNTNPPVVTLESPALISNNTTPAFSGTASESLPVTVELFKGPKVEGKALTKLVAGVSGGKWTTAHTSELANGQYTAIASEPSSLENPTGQSKPPVTFEVETNAPSVTVKSPPSPSSNRSPSFSGTVSKQAGEVVTVFVYEGSTTLGKIVAELSAPVSHGAWTSPAVSPPLPSGTHTYTAVASAPSTIGNGSGKSAPATFVINTEAPVVTLDQPVVLSNNSKPTFSGTASESTAVVVSIYRGATTEGAPLTTATAKGTGGQWTTGPLGQVLEDGQYTAVARQESAIGNGPGKSAAVSFVIDTKPPSITLNGIPSPSPDRVPAFSGSASDHTPVTVTIYKGATPVTTLESEVTGGEWFSAAVSPALALGEYTAVATEASSIGNALGASEAVTFVVEEIAPRVATEGTAAVGPTSAALYGAVNPVGGPLSSCVIQVGPTTAYGRSVACGLVGGGTVFPRAAVGFVPVFIRVYGLVPATTYHYRVLATGEGGTGSGTDRTFTTEAEAGQEHAAAPPPPAKGGVAGLLTQRLVPSGSSAKIGAILRNGGYKQRISASGAGTAVITWYYLRPGAKLGGKGARAPMLVAAGSVTFHGAGAATVNIRLTSTGRRLVRRSRRIRLTMTVRFQPSSGAATTTSSSFQLRR